MIQLKLQHNFTFDDLYDHSRLEDLDRIFMDYLKNKDHTLHSLLLLMRTNELNSIIHKKSDIIISVAKFLETFLVEFFDITKPFALIVERNNRLKNLYYCNKFLIKKQISKITYDLNHINITSINLSVINSLITCISDVDNLYSSIIDFEIDIANAFNKYSGSNDHTTIHIIEEYAKWAMYSSEGKSLHKKGILFKLHQKVDHNNLINDLQNTDNGRTSFFHTDSLNQRFEFDLNSDIPNTHKALHEAHYCILCHNRSKDSCSHGMKDQNNTYKHNELNIPLAGCPLEEKISEMNQLKISNNILAAFAVAIIDNPMIAATGYRICNDCMKSCIYQKQEPVNIPYIESQILDEILTLPWGFEIYSLLTKWNPLKEQGYLPADEQNKAILVVGLGPAGFTLSHYLIQAGYYILAIDGLKIEPLDPKISGIHPDGARCKFEPIHNIHDIYDDLNTRVPQGFGGVMEYGITARWNKNYLKVIRLLIERRKQYRMYGATRFGSNITYDNVLDLGISHIALAMGAGYPKLPHIDNIMANGVRTASDFLMTLQMSDAKNINNVTNLQLRLPIVIIGGGLTAVDAATESLQHYQRSTEDFYTQYKNLSDKERESFLSSLSERELDIVNEFIKHGQALLLATTAKEKQKLLLEWGGATIIYRNKMQNSPAYRLNHEELQACLKEGVYFTEYTSPISIAIDEYDDCVGLYCASTKPNDSNEKKLYINARTVLIAIGTEPNTIIAEECSDIFALNHKYFSMYDGNNQKITDSSSQQNLAKCFFIQNKKDDMTISCFGDLHPHYSGNVVKAMASAKHGHKLILEKLNKTDNVDNVNNRSNIKVHHLFEHCDQLLISKITQIKRLSPTIIEVTVKSPLAAQKFSPGQFFRLQNYSFYASSKKKHNAHIAMEGIALTGAKVNRSDGTISLIALEIGGSSNLCRYLNVGEIIPLMGPTGTATIIPKNEKVLLIGGGLGNAVLFSIGKAMREYKCHVTYFAGYKKPEDRYRVSDIEQAADKVIWCCDTDLLSKNRKDDLTVLGNVIDGLFSYAENDTDNTLKQIDRIIIIGSHHMMNAFSKEFNHRLYKYFSKNILIVASINSPMQCMMKGICGQCIQKHIDPTSGEIEFVYSCKNQDQLMKFVDFSHLDARLSQNSVHEKLMLHRM